LQNLTKAFSNEDNVIVSISVRTAFDVYLQALNIPKGSEILMTAINIPEMVRVIKLHGFVPVPVDVDVSTLAVTPERLEAAITDKTKLILATFTYGVRYDLAEIAKVGKKYNIPIFEDCAEGYVGPSYKGDPNADVTVFSFGPIKHATAFQGAVMIIRNNPEILEKARKIHDSYKIQSGKIYLKKVIKYSGGIVLLNLRWLNYILRPILLNIGFDYKKRVVSLLRGFAPGQGLEVYRFRPCTAMISFLYRRVSHFDDKKFFQGMKSIQEGTDILIKGGVTVPGSNPKDRTFWLYPIVTKDAAKAYDVLNNAGIDAYQGISQLYAVPVPEGSKAPKPDKAYEMFKNLLYLPIHKNVPHKDIVKICKHTVKLLNPKL